MTDTINGDVMAGLNAVIAVWSARLSSGNRNEVVATMQDLMDRLTIWRDQMIPSAWMETTQLLHNSALHPLLFKDPFTQRSYFRPRGIPGDAELLDYIYDAGTSAESLGEASPTGQWIFAAIQARPICKAIRFRRQFAAEFLRDVALEQPDPAILAIGAGHLREVEVAMAGRPGLASRILALEPDPAARAHIARRLPDVETVGLSVHDLLGGSLNGKVFDATYALDPFNYLSDAFALSLLAGQAALVRPGGRILVCNFALEAADRGYMEAFMDWQLIYRDEQDLERLAQKAWPGCAMHLYREPTRQIVFLEMTITG